MSVPARMYAGARSAPARNCPWIPPAPAVLRLRDNVSLSRHPPPLSTQGAQPVSTAHARATKFIAPGTHQGIPQNFRCVPQTRAPGHTVCGPGSRKLQPRFGRRLHRNPRTGSFAACAPLACGARAPYVQVPDVDGALLCVPGRCLEGFKGPMWPLGRPGSSVSCAITWDSGCREKI